MTDDAHTLVGFDPGCDPDDMVVVVLRQRPGEPWQLEHVTAPPQVDTSWIADLVAAADPPAWNPPPGLSLADLVAEWSAEYQPPDFHLSDEQWALLTAAYAEHVDAKRLSAFTHEPCVPAPRTN